MINIFVEVHDSLRFNGLFKLINFLDVFLLHINEQKNRERKDEHRNHTA